LNRPVAYARAANSGFRSGFPQSGRVDAGERDRRIRLTFPLPQPELEKEQLPQLHFVAIEALQKTRQPFRYAMAIYIAMSHQSDLARLRKHLGCQGN